MTNTSVNPRTTDISVAKGAPGRGRAGRVAGRSWWSAVWPPITAFLLLLVVWEIGVRLTGVTEIILPTPSTIAVTLVDQAVPLLGQSWITLQEVLIGLALSIVVGIPLAVLITSFKIFERAVYPLLVASQVIPKVAVAPLLIIWFGFDMTPKIILVFLLAFFPIVVNTATGLRGIPIEKLYLARSMGARPLKTLFWFRLPQALPDIFGGVKIATTLAVIGAVVGEFLSAQSGLGYVIVQANAQLNAPLMFASIVYLTILGVVLFAIVGFIERLALPWHVSRRDSFSSNR